MALLGVLVACNEGFERVLPERDYTDTTSAIGKRAKVLYLIVDGARGQSVRSAGAENLQSLLDHSIYSFNSLSDTLALNGTTWAGMLTGVPKEKHGVLDNNFTSDSLDKYPVVFERIKAASPERRIAAFSTSTAFKNNLTDGADVKEAFSTDEAVKDAVIEELGMDTASVVLGQFSLVDAAGAQFGYDVSVPQYKEAILQFDEYLGEILTALRAREDYAQEDWLVVITSNRGGDFPIDPSEDDNTIFSEPAVNTFVVLYNPDYQPTLVGKPYTGNRYVGDFVRLRGQDAGAINAIVPDDRGLYDFGDTVEFTVELKVKVMPGNQGNYRYAYPSILAKRASFNPGQVGWLIFLEQDYWMINFGQTGKGNQQVRGTPISDGTWHSIAAVVLNREISGVKRRVVRTFTDGVFNNEMILPADWGNINTSAPLTMGFLPGSISQGPADVYMGDVRIWLAELPDEIISQYACDTFVDESHPYFLYLAGYWPCNDGSGGVFKDYSAAENDFQLQGSYGWENINELICPPSSSDLADLVPGNRDIPLIILSWLNISSRQEWGMDGRVWIDNY